jgi:hypothetical protein
MLTAAMDCWASAGDAPGTHRAGSGATAGAAARRVSMPPLSPPLSPLSSCASLREFELKHGFDLRPVWGIFTTPALEVRRGRGGSPGCFMACRHLVPPAFGPACIA